MPVNAQALILRSSAKSFITGEFKAAVCNTGECSKCVLANATVAINPHCDG